MKENRSEVIYEFVNSIFSAVNSHCMLSHPEIFLEYLSDKFRKSHLHTPLNNAEYWPKKTVDTKN
ncbi:MAG: hypothetical protein K9K78_00530 [Spirochaetales bacterium]|nr:hypothetical protein [Spirochaetales bacterium]